MSTPLQAASGSARDPLKHFRIPPQPDSVLEAGRLLGAAMPDLNRIAAAVSKDPSLTARVLKVANSPYFSTSQKIDSVGRALNVMGLNTFKTAVLKSALQEVFSQSQIHANTREMVWCHAELTAACCDIVARFSAPALAANAYLAGLFHDCATLVMQDKFADYGEILPQCLHYSSKAIPLEQARYETDHCTVGYFFAKAWQLPEAVCRTIQYHHNEALEEPWDGQTRMLVAILRLSEYIVQDYDTSGNMKTISPEQWLQFHEGMAIQLQVEADDIRDFETALLERIS